jgi:hypothetical protein
VLCSALRTGVPRHSRKYIVEIGDRVESELDQAYKRYSDYISRHYGWDPAPQAVRIRVNRGISNRSRATTGMHLQNPTEHGAKAVRIAATEFATLG